MSTPSNPPSFGTVYSDFITVLGKIAKKAIEQRNSGAGLGPGQQPPIPESLKTLLQAVLEEVQSYAATFAVDYAAAQLDPTSRNLLTLELKSVSEMYGKIEVQGTQKEVDDGETAKDSILDLLDTWLPDWLKKLLKILDEILSLVRPG